MKRESGSVADLKVSVVLTALNEGSTIRKVILHLLEQTRRPDEIVICDGGSTDDTVPQLQQLIATGAPLKVVVSNGACRGAGRNRAIEASTNPLIALTDAGTIAHPRWLEHLLSPCIVNPSIEVVYGMVIPQMKDRFSRCLAALTIGHSHVNGRLCPTVASLLVRKRVWWDVGGFPEGLTTAEDLIFLDRLRAYAASSTQAPEAMVFWSIPSSLSAIFRRLSLYSRGGLAAGFAKQWHYGTLRNCCIFAFLTLAGLLLHPGLLLGLPCFQGLRVHKYLRRMPWFRQHNLWEIVLNYLFSGLILATMDLATLNGLWRWIVQDHCRRQAITRGVNPLIQKPGN